MSRQLAVSIVNYIHAEKTMACINSLLAAHAFADDDCLLEIWVVDNFSSDYCNRFLENTLSSLGNVHLISLPKNLGFAAGHNKALAEIMENNNFDFVWLLNNDVVVDEGAIKAHLATALEAPEVSMWGSTLLEADGQSVQCAGGCFYSPWLSTFKQYGFGQKIEKLFLEPVPRFDYIVGASMFFPAATLSFLYGVKKHNACKKHTWLNETFFLYFEELDIAQQLGDEAILGWCENARVIHLGGLSTGAGQGNISAVAVYNSTLSALKFTWLYNRTKLLLIVPFRFFAKSLQLLLIGKPSLIIKVIKAYYDFFTWLKRADTP